MLGRDVYHWWSVDELAEEAYRAIDAFHRADDRFAERLKRAEAVFASETHYLRQHNEDLMKAVADYVRPEMRIPFIALNPTS